MIFLNKKYFLRYFFGVSLLFFASITCAENNNPIIGRWQTIDGHTHKPSSIISIQREGDFFVGRITKTYKKRPPGEIPRCNLCKGADYNKRIIGLAIVRRLRCNSDQTKCSGGTILDPRNGDIFKVKLRVIDQGQWLRVHGYIGMAILGRTVYWRRVS